MTRLARTELKLREKERFEAAEAERRRLALDLHDSVTQSLHGVTLLLDNLRGTIQTENDQARKEKLINLISSGARQALREMRLIIYQLKPVEKSEDFIQTLKARLSGVEERAGLKINLNLDPHLHLQPGQQENLSGILMEALNNIIKHAYADTIWIDAENKKNGGLFLSIRDNGNGFDPEKIPPGGMGLQNMTERAAQLGANLDIQSKAGEGTCIQVFLPERTL